MEVVDPVCGMTITPQDAVGHHEHRGQTYYFCADSCLEQFRADPERFLAGPASAFAPGATAAKKAGHYEHVAATEWTCPMHPEVVRSEPGSCPICGMALEPRTITLDESNPELDDMTRRFWASTALTIPALLLAMGEYLPGQLIESMGPASAMNWVQLALTYRATSRP